MCRFDTHLIWAHDRRVSRDQSLTIALAGVGVVVVLVTHGIGLFIGLAMVIIGLSGFVWGALHKEKPAHVLPLVMVLREGRTLRDMIRQSNPDSPIWGNEAKKWKRPSTRNCNA